jgi:hypothetical protein
MGNSFGITRTLWTERLGRSIQVSADGAPKYKAGGITVNWASVPACPPNGGTYYGVTVANGQAEFEDGVIVKVGEKALRYGTVMIYDPALDLQPVTDGDPQGAYRPALTGDMATLGTRSNTFIVNETWLEEDNNSNHIGVMDGGRMFRARIVKSTGTQADTAWVAGSQAETAVAVYDSVGGGVPPTLAAIETALPMVSWALDN